MKLFRYSYLISLFLVLFLVFNSAAQISLTVVTNTNEKSLNLIAHKPAGNLPFLQEDVKTAVIKEITTYLNQFQDTCFGKSISIGDAALFKTAINKNVNKIYVGEEGKKLIAKNSPNAQSYHYTWKLIGMTADIVFPFDPRQLPQGEDGYKNRQTMMHEMTHHIEWLNGVKESSDKGKNPRSERNTDYQDGVVDTLKNLVKIEELLKSNESTVGEILTKWQTIENRLRELEAGSSAGGHLPDANLDSMNGFSAKLETIETHYLSGVCGDDLRDMILLSRLLPKINRNLEFDGPAEITLDESVTTRAMLSNTDLEDMTVPSELKPKYSWEIPGEDKHEGNPLNFKPTKEGNYEIKATLSVTFNKKKHIIAEGDYNLKVNPSEKEPPDKDPKDDKNKPPINPGSLSFSGSAPDNWEGGNTPDGFVLKRKLAKIKGPCGWDSTVSATLQAKFKQSAKPKDAAEAFAIADELFKRRRQGDTPNDMAVGLFMAGGIEGAGNFAMGDYTGAIADFALWMRRGSGGFSGYTGSYFGANGAGNVVKNGVVITFSYSVTGGGCWDNSDRPYLITQGVAAQKEARSILASLRLDDKGLINTTPYNEPKYDGSDLPKVSLSPSKIEKMKIGDTVRVEAIVENEKAEDSPFTYNWSGTFDGKPEDVKKSNVVQIKPTKPGKYTLSVGVDGARFGMGSASLEYVVADYKAEIKQVLPTTPRIVVGAPVSFSAQLLSDGKAVSGNYVYRWQPQPEAKFEPAESAAQQTKAVFSRPGRTKVWVQVLEKKGETLETVAESVQIEIEVINPTLKIVFSPQTVNVGKEVKARVIVTPSDLKDIDFRWEISANARQTYVSTDTSEVTFIPQDTKAVTVTARARVSFYGDDLGTQTAVITATLSQADLDKASAAEKLTEAKGIIRKGQIEEAIALADEAVGLNPGNAEAKMLSQKWKNEKAVIDRQMEKTRQLISQSKFPEAQRELIVAKNLNPYYKPVVDLENELGDKWRKYDWGVREGLGNVRMANEANDFKKALALATQLRTDYQLTPSSEQELRNYEQWAQKHEAEKERQRVILKQGELKFNNGDYDGAIKDFDVMYQNFYNYWSIYVDTEPKYYGDLKAEAVRRRNRINTLLPSIKQTAENASANKVLLETALKNADEVLQLQPNNAEVQNYRAVLAERIARSAVAPKVEEAIKRGETLFGEKKYDDAIRAFEQAIKLDPDNADAYRRRAMAKREKGDLKGALKDFDKTIQLEPNNDKAFLGRGIVKRRLEDLNGALSDFTRGIELNPTYTNGYIYRGNLKTDMKDYESAIEDYNTVLSLDPKNYLAYLNRGVAKSRLQDYRSAIKDYDNAIFLNPKSSLAYNNRGVSKERLNDNVGALKDYEKALELDPDNTLAKSNIEKLKNKIGSETPPTDVTNNLPTGKEIEILNVNNIYGVQNNPTAATTFTIRTPHVITYISTYHWNNGSGTYSPGTIGLRKSDGTMFGPWSAKGLPGQGGVRNAYWEVNPNVVIPAGTYTIVDSNPTTWARNAQSGGKGFAIVKGYPANSNTTTTPSTTPNTTTEQIRIFVTFFNASGQDVHIFPEGDQFRQGNRFAPNESRNGEAAGQSFTQVKIFAGRNGIVLDTITFKVVPNGRYIVTFGKNNKLSVRQK